MTRLALVSLRYAALSLIAAALLLPIWWLLMSSFRPAEEIFRYSGVFGPAHLPARASDARQLSTDFRRFVSALAVQLAVRRGGDW